jgi:hypothetical protein
MKSYPGPAPENESHLRDAANLDLPVCPDFDPSPPRIDAEAMLKRIAENLPWRSTRPGEAERRLQNKIHVEFVL